MDHVDTMESDRDGNADVLLMLMQQLPLQDRLQLSRVSKQWHTAAIAATKDLDATVNDAKSPVSGGCALHRIHTIPAAAAVVSTDLIQLFPFCLLQSLTRWLHRNGTALETLAVHSSEPVSEIVLHGALPLAAQKMHQCQCLKVQQVIDSLVSCPAFFAPHALPSTPHTQQSDIPRQFFIAVKDPVGEVDFVLPSASLPNLHRLRLFNVQVYCGMNLTPGGLPSWGTSSDLVSLPASLTSLKAVDSHYINAYICDLTGLRQLSLSDMDFPMGELRRIATTLTQLTRLRLEWTGAWIRRCGVSGRTVG